MRATAALAVLLVVGACSKQRTPLSQKLQRTLDAAAAAPPCDVMPFEWAKSWPVPLPDGSLKVLFYPATGTPETGPTIYTPGGEGVIAPSLDAFARCAQLPGAPQKLEQQARPAGERGGMEKYRRLSAELLDDTEAVARLYAAKTPPGPAERRVLARYWREFQALAEPGLLPAYYDAAPAFWEWLRPLAGGAVERPKAKKAASAL